MSNSPPPMKRARKIIFFASLLATTPACANAGLPLIFFTYPFFMTALIPVIFLEAWLYRKLTEMSLKKSLAAAALGNLLSTLAGIPLAYFLQAWLQHMTVGMPAVTVVSASGASGSRLAAYLLGSAVIGGEPSAMTVVAAGLVALVPAYAISVLLEYPVAKRFLATWRSVLVVNAASYALLAAWIALAGWRSSRSNIDGIMRAVFPKPLALMHLLRMTPNPTRETVVSSGCVIFNGRYLRRPYALRLSDYTITVNGIATYRGHPEDAGKVEDFFLHEVWFYENGGTSFLDASGRAELSIPNGDERAIQERLLAVDRIVAADLPREEKRKRLLEVPDWFFAASASNADKVLDHWDGIR